MRDKRDNLFWYSHRLVIKLGALFKLEGESSPLVLGLQHATHIKEKYKISRNDSNLELKMDGGGLLGLGPLRGLNEQPTPGQVCENKWFK